MPLTETCPLLPWPLHNSVEVGWNAYRLHLPTSMSRLHPVFNVIKLLPTPSNPIPGWKASLPPPPEIVDGEEHYVVEWILDSQFMRGCLQFLMKWEKYGYEENSWVPEQDVMAPDKLHEFYRIHPGAPCCIRSMAFQSLMSHASRMQHARRGGDVRGCPISHFHCSRFHPTSRLELRSTPFPFPNSAPSSSQSSTPLSLLELPQM